jgi:uncharacterized damage-inducible protein DinB
MQTEPQYFAQVIERIARDVIAQLNGLPDSTLNRPVPLPDTNTLFALGTHTVGMGEFWVLALVGGRRIERNRSAEFHASGSGPELIARFERWIADVHAVLDDLPAAALDEPADPPAEFRTTGNLGAQPLTGRDCLLHVVEHSATHLGQMQITAQLLAALPETA